MTVVEFGYFYAMPFEDYYIWGATAGMLRGFSSVRVVYERFRRVVSRGGG